jgi:hypothetical protein
LKFGKDFEVYGVDLVASHFCLEFLQRGAKLARVRADHLRNFIADYALREPESICRGRGALALRI